MTILVSEFLTKIAYDLQETDNTFSSGLWTPSEVIDYLNYAQGCFINDTGVVVSDNTILSVIGDRDYTRPTNAGDIDRIAFNGKRVRRVSSFDLMSKDPAWRSRSGIPQFYHEDGLTITSFEFDKMPTKVGNIRIFADMLHADITSTSEALVVPDCWEPYIRWEVISFCLQKDGESQDLDRADWAHKKYLFGVKLAQRIVSGESDSPIPEIEA